MFLYHKPGWQPVLDSMSMGKRYRAMWIAGSVALHAALLLVWCWPPEPKFIKPVWLARGQGGTATPSSIVLYLPQATHSAERPLISLPAPSHQKRSARTELRKRTNLVDSDKPANLAEAGSASGTGLDGASEGDDIKPGFAIRFTAPRLSQSELPRGVQGDVIVELTIDARGDVVDEKLLQGLGHEIDDMVIATLRAWHFQPATRNGIAIPFKYDAHFHFPS